MRDDAQKTRDDAQRVRDDTQRAKDTAQGAKDTAQRTKNTAQRVRDDAWRVKVAAQRVKDDAQRAERKAREVLAADLAREEEQERLQSTCIRDGWWDKVPGSATCPECQGVWSFLLRCPDCHAQMCPRCQLSLRPKAPRKTAKKGLNSD